jgi:hypothetical protein
VNGQPVKKNADTKFLLIVTGLAAIFIFGWLWLGTAREVAECSNAIIGAINPGRCAGVGEQHDIYGILGLAGAVLTILGFVT